MSYWIPACAGMTISVVSGRVLLKANCRIFVIPAQAGMTVVLGLSKCHSG
jgi:hypothetical protein